MAGRPCERHRWGFWYGDYDTPRHDGPELPPPLPPCSLLLRATRVCQRLPDTITGRALPPPTPHVITAMPGARTSPRSVNLVPPPSSGVERYMKKV